MIGAINPPTHRAAVGPGADSAGAKWSAVAATRGDQHLRLSRTPTARSVSLARTDSWIRIMPRIGVICVAYGDHVELLVRGRDESLEVSDGGEALARLDFAGVSVDHGRARDMWFRLLRAHELETQDERLIIHGAVDEVGQLIENMANAVTNIDGIRLLTPPPRSLLSHMRRTHHISDLAPSDRRQRTAPAGSRTHRLKNRCRRHRAWVKRGAADWCSYGHHPCGMVLFCQGVTCWGR